MLSTTSDGEALAARQAFLRAVATQGLSLHDIGDRIERGVPENLPPDPGTTSETPRAPGTSAIRPEHDVTWRAACQLVDTIEDDTWPDVADWLAEQDHTWSATHPPRHLLKTYQLDFVHQMQTETRSLRPTQRQCAWLLCLIDSVNQRSQRPPAAPRPRVKTEESATAAAPPAASTPASTPETGATTAENTTAAIHTGTPPTPPPPTNRTRELTGRRQKHVASRLNKAQILDWIRAVATARQRAARPIEQAAQPLLFSGEAVRVLTCLAFQQQSWIIDRRNGHPPIGKDLPVLPSTLAAQTQVTLRSVRRILAHAKAAGFLTVARPGGQGRGHATIYRLAIPNPRQWRWPDRNKGHHGPGS
jgi:hypothetical protein